MTRKMIGTIDENLEMLTDRWTEKKSLKNPKFLQDTRN